MFSFQKNSTSYGRRLQYAAVVLLIVSFGLCAASAMAKTKASGKVSKNNTVILNFQDAKISKIAESVSKITGRNFVLAPQVKGKATMISATPVTIPAAYHAFVAMLASHGFSVVNAGAVVKVVPKRQAAKNAVASNGRRHRLGATMVTKVILVKHVKGAQLVKALRPLLGASAVMTFFPPANALIATGSAANIAKITRIVRRVDKQGKGGVKVFSLRYAKAANVVRVLTGLLKNSGQYQFQPVSLAADARTNSVIVAGSEALRLKVGALIANLDQPKTQTNETQIVYLHYAKAKNMAKALNRYIHARQKIASQSSGRGAAQAPLNAIVVPYVRTNSLVVTASGPMMRAIKQIIDKQDIRRAEVFVQAAIAEVNADQSGELGVTWAAKALDRSPGTVALTNFGSQGLGVAQVASAMSASGGDDSGSAGLSGLAPNGVTMAIGHVVDGGLSFAALLRALTSSAHTNILSAPSLVTLDNQEAKITVGKQVPFVTGSYTNSSLSGDGLVNPFQTIERKQVGITLKLTPQINKGDVVKLKIHLTVANLAQSSQKAVDLVTNHREITTKVRAKDGQIIVLGGLMQNQKRETVKQVPLLGDIPLLGNLFKYHSSNSIKQNLMVFIRPKILRTSDAMSYYTNAKYGYMRQLQLGEKAGMSTFGNTDSPVLPPFKSIQKHPPVQTGAGGDAAH